jgi:histidine triad (HIT) family protein
VADTCIFCEIAAGDAPAELVASYHHTIAIVPINPVTAGHILFIPRRHVSDFTANPEVSAQTMHDASLYAGTTGAALNLITSRGRAATQSVFHLHLHLVPRRKDDGLALPWYSGKGNHT